MTGNTGTRLYKAGGRLLLLIARLAALCGGILLIFLAAMSVVSILGRWLAGIPPIATTFSWVGTVPGDFELMEMGNAIAVFLFLPYCQLRYGHVAVDIFISPASPRLRALITLLVNLLFTVVAALMTWRLYLGMEEKVMYGETTMMLGLPMWYGFAPSVAMLGFLTVVCSYTVLDAVLGLFRGEDPYSRNRGQDMAATGE
ncbi:MAG: TRAP transporter small permease [Aquisalimonadaceae bacterium]